MFPFALKKFISQFLMPMPLVCECFLLGWILTRFTKYKKTGKVFYLLAFTLFLVFGYGFGRTYLYNLERRYPPFDPTPEQCESLRGAPVVVLGQGMPVKSDLPLRYQNNPVFDRRLFEGVRCAKLIPESRLIVSMAGEASNSIKQAFLAGYMLQVNFPTNRVTMFTTARDTAEEAKLANARIRECANAKMRECANATSNQVSSFKFQVSSLSTNARMNSRTNELSNFRTLELPRRGVASSEAGSNFRTNSVSSFRSQNFRTLELSNFRTNVLILTTSAAHLPRAMKIFQKQGLNPIASPCDYTDSKEPKLIWERWYQWPLPNGKNIEDSERALYEWLGNIFERTF